MKKIRIFLILILVVCAGILTYRGIREDFRDWLRKADAPIVKNLNRGETAYQKGDYARAGEFYARAEQLAAAADTAALNQWRKKGAQSKAAWKNKADELKPRDRFLAGKDNAVYRGGTHYFQNRISEAAYGLALSRFQELRARYQLRDSAAFAPPDKALTPALEALDRGLNACPQSESLRLLKAEILAAAGRYAQAIKLLEETLLIDPQSAEAYNQLGLIYSSRVFLLDTQNWQKNQAKAIEMFKKATLGTALNGGRLADPLFNLGAFYATPDPSRSENARPAAADAALARKYLRAYLDLIKDPEHPGAQAANKILKRLK